MSSRAAGSVLLHHLGPRVFGPVSSPAAAAPRPLLALAGGGERGAAAVWVRLLSTAAAEAKEEAAASKGSAGSTVAAKAEAAASKGNAGSTAAAKAEAAEAVKEGDGKKSPVVNSYWGIEPSKLVNKDGVEWRWSCFRVSRSSPFPA
jgi:ubiquinol oxidase